MAYPKQLSVVLLLPTVLISFVAFVLAMIALLAGTGSQQTALEPYHIIAVNLSNFGQDLIPTKTSSGDSKPSETSGSSWLDSIIDGAEDLGQDIGDDITDGLNNITGGIADKFIEKLGISEWYSVHILSGCEGMFAPNASEPGAWFNLTNCTAPQAGFKLNLSEILDYEIKAGPLKLNLNQLPIPDDVQNSVDTANDALFALLVLYSLASALAGLSFLLSLAVIILLRKKVTKPVIWGNVTIASLGTLVLLIGSAIITYINNKAIAQINASGKDVGITAIRGSKLITLTWITFALMFILSLYWGLATSKYSQKWIPGRRSKNVLP
ncbi:actin cortical patch SUR7/pH-response regulator pali [Nemania sp. FL0916]|nr:actin cortical patch SUR7/pH-response regulator pali [Nemania sp. FL0916]